MLKTFAFEAIFFFLPLKEKISKNKAGYTAISCGRVGRGGNTHFPTFQLERDRPTDQPTNQPTDGRTKPLIELRVRN